MAYTPKQNSFRNNKQPHLSKEEYIAKRKAEKDAVYKIVDDGMADILSGKDGLMKYLDVQSHFDSYSVANAVLIAQQMPQATQLKAYESWGESSVKVKQNSKAISILEPYTYTSNDGAEKVGYSIKKLFDISQTTARPRNPQPKPDIKDITMALMRSSIVECERADSIPIENSAAYFNEKDNKIYLVNSNPVKLFQDLVREIALAEISYNDTDYNRAESLPSANCTAYMICKRYGIDTNGIPVTDALNAWQGKEPKDMRINLSMARDSNKAINVELYNALHKEAPEQTPER